MANGYSDEYGTYDEYGNVIDYYRGVEPTRGVAEPMGVIPPEVGPRTNTTAQLISFIKSLFAPKAHDSINNIIEQNNIPSIERSDGTIDTLQLLANEQYNSGNLPESERLRLANELMATDELLLKRSQGFPPGPNVMTIPGKSYSDRNILSSLLEEFGAAQPLSPHRMPR